MFSIAVRECVPIVVGAVASVRVSSATSFCSTESASEMIFACLDSHAVETGANSESHWAITSASAQQYKGHTS